jgi:protein ImuB
LGPVTRPLRLLEGPRAIEVMAVVPEGPPIRFDWEGRGRRVVRYWGPERIETGWWADGGVARDYYRVETDTGEWYWLFRRRGDARWFVHGVFE